jgi:acyl-CoA synthetase (AMP-forming)/AMP-acid ligase II
MTQGYGSSECGQLTVLKPQDQLRKFGRTGQALVCVDLAVLDEHFGEVPAGEIGEIVTRGPHVMAGYLNRPADTEEAFRSGWCHTGYMAVIDDEGFVTIVDRRTDMIISGGENIYPKEVEGVILSHPAVQEAAVFGIPDEQWVESVCAAVVVKPGMEISEKDVVDHCRKYLAGYKKPRVVTFMGALPKNDWGKVMKNALRAPYWQGTGRRI